MTKKMTPKRSHARSVPVISSFPVDEETTIRAVPVLPNRKKPVGYVAHHWRPCNFSTAIMCDGVTLPGLPPVETGYEAAKRLLNAHLANCPYHLPVPN